MSETRSTKQAARTDLQRKLDTVLWAALKTDAERTAFVDAQRRAELPTALRAIRRASQMSQASVATDMATTQSAISDIENGRVEPTLRTLQRHARALGRRADVAVVEPSLPEYSEETAREVWRELWRHMLGPLFRRLAASPSDLVRLGDLEGVAQPAILNELLVRLVSAGWLAQPEAQSITLDDRAAVSIGISIEPGVLRGAVADLRTHLITTIDEPFSTEDFGPSQAVRVITALARRLHSSMNEDQKAIGVGVCLAGGVTSRRGAVRFAPELQSPRHDWHNVDLEELLQTSMQKAIHRDLRVVVENDANALAIRDYLHTFAYATHTDACSAVILMTETGIGSGLVMHGGVLHGRNGLAGEAGHMPAALDSDTPCSSGLGHTGCLESVASPHAICDSVLGRDEYSKGATSRLLDVAKVIAEKSEQDLQSRNAVYTAGQYLGRYVSDLVVIADPGRVVVFGPAPLMEDSESAALAFRQGVDHAVSTTDFAEAETSRETDLQWRSLNDRDRALAACATVTAQFIRDPAHWVPGLLIDLGV